MGRSTPRPRPSAGNWGRCGTGRSGPAGWDRSRSLGRHPDALSGSAGRISGAMSCGWTSRPLARGAAASQRRTAGGRGVERVVDALDLGSDPGRPVVSEPLKRADRETRVRRARERRQVGDRDRDRAHAQRDRGHPRTRRHGDRRGGSARRGAGVLAAARVASAVPGRSVASRSDSPPAARPARPARLREVSPRWRGGDPPGVRERLSVATGRQHVGSERGRVRERAGGDELGRGPPAASRWPRGWIRAVRVRQWPKNVLVFALRRRPARLRAGRARARVARGGRLLPAVKRRLPAQRPAGRSRGQAPSGQTAPTDRLPRDRARASVRGRGRGVALGSPVGALGPGSFAIAGAYVALNFAYTAWLETSRSSTSPPSRAHL